MAQVRTNASGVSTPDLRYSTACRLHGQRSRDRYVAPDGVMALAKAQKRGFSLPFNLPSAVQAVRGVMKCEVGWCQLTCVDSRECAAVQDGSRGGHSIKRGPVGTCSHREGMENPTEDHYESFDHATLGYFTGHRTLGLYGSCNFRGKMAFAS